MRIRKRAGSALLVGAAVVTAIGFGATTALATSATLTVKVTKGGSYTAKSSKTVLTDHGVSVTCSSSKAGGSVPTKTYRNAKVPVKVGTTAKLSFSGCTGPLGKVTVKVSKLPYHVTATSKTNAKGQTDGLITGASTSVSMTGCSFKVTGSAPGFYSNGSHKLTLTPKLPNKAMASGRLTVSNVNGCAGLVSNGDHPSYKSTYTLSRAFVIKAS